MTPPKRPGQNRFRAGARVLVGMSRQVGTVLHVDDEPSIMGEYVHRVRTKNGELETVGCDLELVPEPQTNVEPTAPSEEQDDRTYARLAIEEAWKSAPEDKRVHPKVGVVVVKDGKVLASAHRGEIPECHAEYIALEKKLAEVSLAGATVYTTLEPCTSRNHPKVPCAIRLAERRVGRVVIGMLDPDDRISGRGQRALRKAGIATDLFPGDLMGEVEELNRDFVRDRESRETERNGEQQAPPECKPAIVGTADLMLQELDISDLEITNDMSSYKVNAAVFARIEVAALDRPRTVTHFEIEMIAPDETKYSAKSEYEVGQYDHKHDVSKKDLWGFATVESVREPMEDLAAKLRTPILPLTHVPRAWVRFEIKGVMQGHEPNNCQIKIFAVDPSGMRHEIRTDDMQVKAIDDDKEYAVIRGK